MHVYITSVCRVCAGTQATYTRPAVTASIGARMAASPAGTTYVKTTSGSIITVVPKSLATLGGKIISTNIVSGNLMGEKGTGNIVCVNDDTSLECVAAHLFLELWHDKI